jgi:glycosyltransferase involved in cell wall biosynthesis
MPAAVAAWGVPRCDLLVSFSHCVVKALRVPAGVPHVSYCFTPMRYAWHMRQAYFGQGRYRGLKARAVDYLLGTLREWDRRTASHVTHFIAISQTIRKRIADCYGRASEVIYPPVDTQFYTPTQDAREDYYLVVSAFAPYKRVDLAMEACRRLGRKLVVIGTGQDEERLRGLATPGVHFLGWQSDEVIRQHLRRCRALLFPGEEDFGIVPVEAMACGAPVIAFGRGGATETVIPEGGKKSPTGVWFEDQTVESLIDALERFEPVEDRFDPAAARQRALHFSKERFRAELMNYLDLVGSVPARGIAA